MFEKIELKYYQKIKDSNDEMIDVYLDLKLRTSKVYLEQIQCLVFSENGLKTVSPYLLFPKSKSAVNNAITTKDLEVYQILFKKQKAVTYKTKN